MQTQSSIARHAFCPGRIRANRPRAAKINTVVATPIRIVSAHSPVGIAIPMSAPPRAAAQR
jgi:hypothetical protein